MAHDVKDMCQNLLARIGQRFVGEATFSDAEVREVATALSTLSRELAEARADARKASERHATSQAFEAAAKMRMEAAEARALAAESSSASKDERIRELEDALAAAEPYVELAHSTAQAKDVRAMVWKRLLQIRAARSTKEPT